MLAHRQMGRAMKLRGTRHPSAGYCGVPAATRWYSLKDKDLSALGTGQYRSDTGQYPCDFNELAERRDAQRQALRVAREKRFSLGVTLANTFSITPSPLAHHHTAADFGNPNPSEPVNEILVTNDVETFYCRFSKTLKAARST